MRSFGIGLRLASSLAMTALLAAGTPPAAAQAPEEINRLFEQVAALDADGRHAEALDNARSLLGDAERKYGAGSQETGTFVNVVAVLLHGRGQFDDAERYYRRSLAIREKVLGTDHLDVGSSLENLGRLYLDQGRAGEAEWFYIQALSINEHALGPDDPVVVATRGMLARAQRAKGVAAKVQASASGLRIAGAPPVDGPRAATDANADIASMTIAASGGGGGPAVADARRAAIAKNGDAVVASGQQVNAGSAASMRPVAARPSAGTRAQAKVRPTRPDGEATNWSETVFRR